MKNLRPARMSDEPVQIKAYAPLEGSKEFRATIFPAANIDSLLSFDEQISALVLKNGVTIPVGLPLDDLYQKIYTDNPNEKNIVDLSESTGAAFQELKAIRLSKKFNPAAESAPGKEKPLEIITFAHYAENDREFRLLRIKESDIDHFEPHRLRKTSETYVELKSASSCDWDCFYIRLPITTFMAYLQGAKTERRETLDLMNVSRPTDPKDLVL